MKQVVSRNSVCCGTRWVFTLLDPTDDEIDAIISNVFPTGSYLVLGFNPEVDTRSVEAFMILPRWMVYYHVKEMLPTRAFLGKACGPTPMLVESVKKDDDYWEYGDLPQEELTV